MNYTISYVSKKFKISRSTLLYYDGMGLLSPTRSDAGYRVYSEGDLAALEEIMLLRSAGVSLQDIQKVLGQKSSRRADILRKRLGAINDEMCSLGRQQEFILGLLGSKEITGKRLNKERWVSYLRKAGLDDAGMLRWHSEFEMSLPKAHQEFLESLGIGEEEIKRIRAQSRKIGKAQGAVLT